MIITFFNKTSESVLLEKLKKTKVCVTECLSISPVFLMVKYFDMKSVYISCKFMYALIRMSIVIFYHNMFISVLLLQQPT